MTRLGQVLIARGVLSHKSLITALAEQTRRQRTGRLSKLGDILVETGLISHEALDAALDEQDPRGRGAG